MTSNFHTTDKPWYAQLWPWLLMLGPAAVVVAGAFTIWLAVTRQDALVVDDYYKQGKAINQDLRRAQVAAQLGVHGKLRYDPASGTLTGEIASRERALHEPVRLRLVHATRPEKDLLLIATPDHAGKFSVALPLLEKARWQVLIEAQDATWRINGVWMWPQQRMIYVKAG